MENDSSLVATLPKANCQQSKTAIGAGALLVIALKGCKHP